MAVYRFDKYIESKKDNYITSNKLTYLLLDEIYNVLFNSFDIEPITADFNIKYVEKKFVKDNLLKRNKVGYDKITKKWYMVNGENIDQLGNPTTLMLNTMNGKVFRRNAYYDKNVDGAYIIYCLPSSTPYISILEEYIKTIVETEISLKQNLKASRTPYIVTASGKNKALSIKQALKQKEEGFAFIVVDSDLKDNLQAINVAVEFLASELYDLKQKMINDLYSKIGILTTEFKKERVQSAEINGSIDKVIDYTNMLINGVNNQFEDYDIKCKLVINGAIDKLYTDNLESKASNNLLDDKEGVKDEE